ncbi:MAG: hypothetical protein ABJD97_21345 [Betaproteobacteria bacterium]
MNVATAIASGKSSVKRLCVGSALGIVLVFLAGAASAATETNIYYQCPGNVFTNTITAKEAEAKGCKSKEAQQPTTIPAPKVRANGNASASPSGPASRVDAQEQKARDTDARKILQDELIKAQGQLETLQKEYNNGQPERRGDEKNFQKYLDRTADLKASIARTESDIAAITRELAKTQ